MENCKICNSEMKLIPAGVSKATGKPYQSFMACPNKCRTPLNNTKAPNPYSVEFNAIRGQFEDLNKRLDSLADYLKAHFDGK